jgi:phage gp29-like protein
VHNEVRIDIRNADAWQFENTINRDLIQPYVDLNYGPQKRYPYYAIDISEPEDLKLLAEALIPFIELGLPVMQRTILEKFGLPEPDGTSELLKGDVIETRKLGEDDGTASKLSALKTWLEVEAARNTNMRSFRKMLAERLEAT